MNTPVDGRQFYVVIPFYNEERGMAATLQALANQVDRDFSLVLVDNASTDASAALAAQFVERNNFSLTYIVHEPVKGTGAAADAGFRFSIARGARWIARTDADCVPDPYWIRNLKTALCEEGLEFVAGRILPRTDEWPLTPARSLVLGGMIWLAENYGRVFRRGPQFRYPYFLVAGNNLAISASLYERSGGFPRTALETLNEDRALSESVRTLTTRAALRRNVIVRNSARRVHAYGVINTLRWYRNRGYRPDVVDIR